jgi:hypothetical protein
MTITATCADQDVVRDIRSSLANIHGVQSASGRVVENNISIFVALSEDSPEVRTVIYSLESSLRQSFPDFRISFRVIALDPGEEFKSSHPMIYNRAA